MESLEILKEATAAHISKGLATFLFLISGIGVSFNYYFPALMPATIIGGMYYYITYGFIGMTYSSLKYRKNPHISSETCPKCKNRVKYTGIKCLSEDCNYRVKL